MEFLKGGLSVRIFLDIMGAVVAAHLFMMVAEEIIKSYYGG